MLQAGCLEKDGERSVLNWNPQHKERRSQESSDDTIINTLIRDKLQSSSRNFSEKGANPSLGTLKEQMRN